MNIPEAWRHGPVFPSLYREFKHRRHLPIIDLATEAYLNSRGNFKEDTPEIRKDDEDTHAFLSEIWRIYGRYTASQLSEMCHRAGTPWATTRENDPRVNAHISDEVMGEYYKELLEREPEEV